jgi:hypothetical protein
VAAAFPLIIWIVSIGVSVYVIAQTESSGLSPEAKKARTRTIVWGFAPIFGIELLIQAYFYAKYRSSSAGSRTLDSVSASFDGGPSLSVGTSSTTPTTKPTSQPTPSAAQSQQSNNPFL